MHDITPDLQNRKLCETDQQSDNLESSPSATKF
jgi:hypothetical protein